MPNFVSKLGVWEPAQERVVDPNAPKGQEIYEGPDRGALEMLRELGVDQLGAPYETDPELVSRSRQLGYKSVDEYLKVMGVDVQKSKIAQETKLKEVITHKNPEPKPGVNELAGGRDYSGQGKHKLGGFGSVDDAKSK